ncbi:aminopeptidase P family N-terminal domain-containing protein [Mesorhizobium sp. M0751]|uniref:aminopeptidase P family N-terminal domain-containing protein n=1 Tax=Mesorhizobium sp. M0751 TaxID=2956992 RepID=UPI00333DD4F5
MLLNEARLKQRMSAAGLDALIATTPENVTYMSGFWALPQWIRRGPQAYVVWPAPDKGTPEIIASTSTLDLVADQDVWVSKVRRYGDFYADVGSSTAMDRASERHLQLRELPRHRDAITALIAALEEAQLGRGRIGIDEAGLAPGYLEALRAHFLNASFLPATALLREVRAVKTADEIERLCQFAQID